MAEEKKTASKKKPAAAAPEAGAPEASTAPPAVRAPEAGNATAPAAAPPTAEAAAPAPAAKPAKKTAKAKKEEAPAAEAPKENLSLDPNAIEPVKIIKAKGSKNIHSGVEHILSTFNNTIVTITDMNGNVIGRSSAGNVGFKGSRKQ